MNEMPIPFLCENRVSGNNGQEEITGLVRKMFIIRC